MHVKVVLVDINPKMIQAWHATFEENPEVDIIHGSLLDQQVDAWVTPTNSQANMDGGLDAIIKGHLGPAIEYKVQQEIASQFHGYLPVGCATCIATGRPTPKYLLSTPTMHSSAEDISDSLNVALACAAAFQVIHMQNAKQPGSITSVALPGLGANTGKVPAEICADLMWTGYQLFLDHRFSNFADLRSLLEEQLGDLGQVEPKLVHKVKKITPPPGGAAPTKNADIDFDDFD